MHEERTRSTLSMSSDPPLPIKNRMAASQFLSYIRVARYGRVPCWTPRTMDQNASTDVWLTNAIPKSQRGDARMHRDTSPVRDDSERVDALVEFAFPPLAYSFGGVQLRRFNDFASLPRIETLTDDTAINDIAVSSASETSAGADASSLSPLSQTRCSTMIHCRREYAISRGEEIGVDPPTHRPHHLDLRGCLIIGLYVVPGGVRG